MWSVARECLQRSSSEELGAHKVGALKRPALEGPAEQCPPAATIQDAVVATRADQGQVDLGERSGEGLSREVPAEEREEEELAPRLESSAFSFEALASQLLPACGLETAQGAQFNAAAAGTAFAVMYVASTAAFGAVGAIIGATAVAAAGPEVLGAGIVSGFALGVAMPGNTALSAVTAAITGVVMAEKDAGVTTETAGLCAEPTAVQQGWSSSGPQERPVMAAVATPTF